MKHKTDLIKITHSLYRKYKWRLDKLLIDLMARSVWHIHLPFSPKLPHWWFLHQVGTRSVPTGTPTSLLFQLRPRSPSRMGPQGTAWQLNHSHNTELKPTVSLQSSPQKSMLRTRRAVCLSLFHFAMLQHPLLSIPVWSKQPVLAMPGSSTESWVTEASALCKRRNENKGKEKLKSPAESKKERTSDLKCCHSDAPTISVLLYRLGRLPYFRYVDFYLKSNMFLALNYQYLSSYLMISAFFFFFSLVIDVCAASKFINITFFISAYLVIFDQVANVLFHRALWHKSVSF